MINKIIAIVIFATAVFGSTPAFSAAPETLKVAIAADLLTVMDTLKSDYLNSHKDVNVLIIPGSSGQLTSQILNGAPYDLFLSADTQFPKKIQDAGLAANKPAVYALGKLVLLTTLKMDLSGGIKAAGLKSVKTIAIANPLTAPYGKAAVAALKNAGLLDAVKGKLVYAQNISAAAQYTITSADIGFLGKSIIFDKKLKKFNKEGVYWVEVDPSLYPKLKQSMVILKNGANNTAAKTFFDYMLSKRAQTIMKKYGYYFETAGKEK